MRRIAYLILVVLMLSCSGVYAEDSWGGGDQRITVSPYGEGVSYTEVYRGVGKGTFIDFVRIQSNSYQESELGLGTELYKKNGLSILGILYATTGNSGQVWLQPLVSVSLEKDRFGAGVTATHYIPMNDQGGHVFLVEPAYVEYKLDKNKNWSLGISATGIKIDESDWIIKSGPMARIYDAKGFWEIRAVNNNDSQEFWLRKTFSF